MGLLLTADEGHGEAQQNDGADGSSHHLLVLSCVCERK
jgi:hypothetical protein